MSDGAIARQLVRRAAICQYLPASRTTDDCSRFLTVEESIQRGCVCLVHPSIHPILLSHGLRLVSSLDW